MRAEVQPRSPGALGLIAAEQLAQVGGDIEDEGEKDRDHDQNDDDDDQLDQVGDEVQRTPSLTRAAAQPPGIASPIIAAARREWE